MPEDTALEDPVESVSEPTTDEGFQDLDEAFSDAEGEVDGDLDTDEEVEPEASTFDLDGHADELVTVTIDGEDTEVSVGELRQGYMRQGDYTQKTQSLAADRNAAEQYNALDKAFAADPLATLNQLAEAYGLDSLQAAPQNGQIDDGYVEELDPMEKQIQELQEQIQGLTGNQQAQEQAAQQAALDAEFEGIKTANDDPDLQFAELINFAVDNSIGDMQIAYEVMSSRKAATNGVDAGLAPAPETKSKPSRKAAKRAAPPVEGGATRQGSGPALGDSPTLEEALAAAEQEHGIRL